jgi:hypothetical protein
LDLKRKDKPRREKVPRGRKTSHRQVKDMGGKTKGEIEKKWEARREGEI